MASLVLGQGAHAADILPTPRTVEAGSQPSPLESYFSQWFERVDATSAAPPNWAAPLTTVTPLLKEFVMYGQAFQRQPNGARTTVYDGGMAAVGLHLDISKPGSRLQAAADTELLEGPIPEQTLSACTANPNKAACAREPIST